ncbi:MAG: hypothetical protein ACJARD_000497 [Alphaproteobacteria bacterium]|jgi:membrane protein implicated in regulation of membrane protease activity
MSEIAIAIKRIIIFLLLACIAYFLMFFILVNDHSVTIYFSPMFYLGNFDVKLAVWLFLIYAVLFGVVITSIISWLYVSKQEAYYEILIKENAELKNRLDRVKNDVSKCVV